MGETRKSFRIQVTTAAGQVLFWHKKGQAAELPEDMVDTWVSKFRPDIWEITATGEMVGAGRATGPTFKIAKVEKIPV